MADKKYATIKVEIWEYWISWLSDEYKLYMIVKIGDKLHFLERKLEDS